MNEFLLTFSDNYNEPEVFYMIEDHAWVIKGN